MSAAIDTSPVRGSGSSVLGCGSSVPGFGGVARRQENYSSHIEYFEQHVAPLGAESFCCWETGATSRPERYLKVGQTPDSVLEATRDLAARCIAARELKMSLIPSPESYLLVASPFNDPNRLTCVTVAFPGDLSEFCEETSVARFRAVEQFVARLQDVQQERQPSPGAELSKDTNDASAQTDQSTVLTWSELGTQFGRRVRQTLQNRFWVAVWVVLASGLLSCVPIPYRVRCEVVCEPSLRRYVAAPHDARLESCDVTAGQYVTKGQRIATLDGGELRSKIAALQAESAQAQQRLFAALSSGDHSKSEFERLETEQIANELTVLQTRQQQLEICAPIDGIIVNGNLERAQGTPLSTGDPLFEIASLDRIVAEIAIPEPSVRNVNEGMLVTVSLDAAPGKIRQSTLTRIHLRNELRDNQSVYIAEAELENPHGELRPGMSGLARVHAGYAPLGWILFHRPYYAARRWIGW